MTTEAEYRRRFVVRVLGRLVLFLVLLSLLLFFISCGSSRKVESTTEEVIERDSLNRKWESISVSDIKLTDLVKTDIGIRFEWVSYDTDKPADENGKHPVLNEGSGEILFQEEEIRSVVGNDSTVVKGESEEISVRNTQTETVVEEEKESIFSEIRGVLKILSIVIIVFFMVVLLWKIRK